MSDNFVALVDQMQARARTVTSPLFTTDAADLFKLFLDELPPEHKQGHTCRACRRFVEAYGGLVTIDDNGHTSPAFWPSGDDVPRMYRDAMDSVRRFVIRARVTGVFLTPDPFLGTPENEGYRKPAHPAEDQLAALGATPALPHTCNGDHPAERITWRHFAVQTPATARMWRGGPTLTADQRMAELREEYGMLQRGLAELATPDRCRQVRAMLSDGRLYRAEKALGIAEWLCQLHDARDAAGKDSRRRDNVTWLTVATAPAGFCHVKTTVISTLLDDLALGRPFNATQQAWNRMMDPRSYQRPQAPPSVGNIDRAEKLIEQLGLAPALRRRFATMADVQRFEWRMVKLVTPDPPASIFAGLKAEAQAKPPVVHLSGPPATMTWVKFRDTVLARAERIEWMVPSVAHFFALVTAADPEAKPILQWDREDRRNPVSWYTYISCSPARSWNLNAGAWVDVAAIALAPHMWANGTGNPNHVAGVMLVIDGCRDVKYERGAGFFPEILRSELHEIRATLEAHTKRTAIEGADGPMAAGPAWQRLGGNSWQGFHVRVTRDGIRSEYRVDRWD
jgi:hypothetical protein